MKFLKKNISKSFYLVLFFLFGQVLCISAQQDSQFAQYMYNTASYNPAYVGTRDFSNITAIYRNQWVGIEGAPETLSANLSTPFSNNNYGIGLSFIQDKIGASTESTIGADISYEIILNNNNMRLSFGVKAGINILDVDFTKLAIYDPNDPIFQNNIDNRVSPIAGAGFYLYNDTWYAGLSSPNLLSTKHYNDISVSIGKERPNFYLMGGLVEDLGSNIKFKPAFLVKAIEGAPLGVDVSANFLFEEILTLGAAYRWDAAISGLAAFQISKQILIGYSYDFDTTDLSNYSNGSHEVFLSFNIGYKTEPRTLSPRFF